mmetsp:Transcript_71055/g.141174  ORF Transcript_71055/g.141174 Transcript_71055/m.141174 type:complete len:338 (-) Transcript_71055:100-1113(-)
MTKARGTEETLTPDLGSDASTIEDSSDDTNSADPNPCAIPEAREVQIRHGRKLSVDISAQILDLDGKRFLQEAWTEDCQIDGEGPETPPPSGTVIFFDWDDTLLPTTAATSGGWSGTSPPEAAEALKSHAQMVQKLLREARNLGRVSIITLAQRPWVQFTAEKYLHGVDWNKLFRELGIHIVYAREALPKGMREAAMKEEGVDFYVVCKAMAMTKALKKMKLCVSHLNMISIGDSRVEMQAAREVAWSQDSDLDFQVKTIKLREEPSSVQELTEELRSVLAYIWSMTFLTEDLDIELDRAESPDSPISLQRSRRGWHLCGSPSAAAKGLRRTCTSRF